MDILFILVSIAIITVLIVVHEFGHFLAAKHYGFQTPIFGVGLPVGPHIDLFKKWDTQFRFYWFLIGGFVSIPELGDETDAELLKKLEVKNPLKQFPVGQRAVVASGGIVFNILFAFLLCIMMTATVGLPQAVADSKVTGFVSEEAPAKLAGILAGDQIIAVNGFDIADGAELKTAIGKFPEQKIRITVKRSSVDAAQEESILNYDVDSPGAIGVTLAYKQEYKKFGFNPIAWVWESLIFVFNNLMAMFLSVGMIFLALFKKIIWLFAPQAVTITTDLGQVKGIVGIVQIISEDIRHNWAMVYQFSILLSLNLAVINLLPIPALDGGHLLFMAYEAMTGKKASEKLQEISIQFGFVFLLSVIAITTFNDIKNWIVH